METKLTYKDNDVFYHRSIDEKPRDESFNMHAHERFEIFYFISGDCAIIIEGTEYKLEPHDILIMRPAEAHKMRILSDTPYERIAIRFSSALLKKFEQSEKLSEPFFGRELGKLNMYKSSNFSTPLYRYCIESLGENTPISKESDVQHKLFLLLCEITKVYDLRDDKSDTNINDDISVKLINFINKNLFDDLSLQSISQEFYLSQSQVNRIFRRITGSSVWEYITIKRLLTARNSIREGQPIGKVCSDCGFNDYSSFYRMYKKTFGLSPREDTKKK